MQNRTRRYAKYHHINKTKKTYNITLMVFFFFFYNSLNLIQVIDFYNITLMIMIYT